MKWIQSSPGSYRLVDDSDERPAVKLPNRRFTEGPTKELKVKFLPSWKKYEEKMHHGTPAEQREASELFTAEREKEINTSRQASSWEKGRREWFQKQKHDWRQKEIQKLDD
jgi:hypothetical protein